jgi:integrase
VTAAVTPAAGTVKTPLRARLREEEAAALTGRYPARAVPARWEATAWDRDTVTVRLAAAPFAAGVPASMNRRRIGLGRFLDWLQQHPGDTWQQRWLASGIAGAGQPGWRPQITEWLIATGRASVDSEGLAASITSGLGQLIYADVIRPGLSWLLASSIPFPFGRELARVRDPDGFAALEARAIADGVGFDGRRKAIEQIAVILAAKGGTIADITVGDCLELMGIRDARAGTLTGGKGAGFYQLLHAAGIFPPGAPATLRMLNPHFQGQLRTGELIDLYALACQPVRDLLVDYLNERQPSIDYASLRHLAYYLGKLFWKDLETHNPGIDSLRLPPDAAAAWKQRLATRTVLIRDQAGNITKTTATRMDTISCLAAVRAFYLDISHWAAEDPARWSTWAVPSPVRREEISPAKRNAHRKSRMDQRTRERLPALPALIAAVDQARKQAAGLLGAAAATPPGQMFTSNGITMRRSALTSTRGQPHARVWAEDPGTGRRRDLTREEEKAFWTWAAVEVLRATGIRLEELTELSHHSLIQYQLPASGELIPLLHIAPSKTDIERLLVISPELADVLAAIIARVRDDNGAVPLVIGYDVHEAEFTPPMPVLFQRRVGTDSRPVSAETIRRWITGALSGTSITDTTGKPLAFKPHDFRRIFATDAIMNGMPPHICQLLMGHGSINTTMGYKAVYPEEAINGHRAFITRRREQRPSAEYRAPTEPEWEEFLGHFERRKLALGDCGRAYGTGCVHEHSCIRCPLLRIDPAQRPRLEAIRASLTARIAEAEREGWTGEAEGLKVSLAAASNKLAQIEITTTRRNQAISLGMPTYRDTAARTITSLDNRTTQLPAKAIPHTPERQQPP